MARKSDRRLLVVFLALALLAVALVLIPRAALRPTDAPHLDLLPPTDARPPGLLPLTDVPYLDLLRRGDGHAARVERTAAVAAYWEAAHLRPGDPVPYLRLAQVYLDWGRINDALTALAEAEELLGEGGHDLAALAARLEQLRVASYVVRADWPAVVEHAQRFLSLPLYDEAGAVRHTLARAYVELGEWDAARAEYKGLLEADPGDSLAHERLGLLLLGDDLSAFEHLLAAETGLAGRLLTALQEPGAADDPAYADALLGRVLFEEREWALAARQFERVLLNNPDYADAHAYLGYALDQMDRPDEAVSHLLQALAMVPDSVVVRVFLGLHYDRLGNVAAARSEYEMAYDLDPDNPATCVEIGQTWAAEGRYVAAEIWLREAVALRPDDPTLWEVLARFYLDHNISGEGRGVEAATRLLELLPEDARAHNLRGWAALQIGDYDTARDYLLQSISLDPALASAHYHLGLLWSDRGMYQKAREAFTRALDLDTTGELIPLVERAMSEVPIERPK